MVSYAAFKSISVTSQRHLTLIIHVFPGFHHYEAGALKCLVKGHSHEKKPEDPVQLKPRTPNLKSNTLPPSHMGPLVSLVGCVLGFNATLTAKIMSWRSVTLMCFLDLTPVLTQLLSKATDYFSHMLLQR